MGLSNIYPGPWAASDGKVDAANGNTVCRTLYDPEAEFIALARNAFDVMMRRGWWVVPHYGRAPITWSVRLPQRDFAEIEENEHGDPFTALVETDKWYKENVENK